MPRFPPIHYLQWAKRYLGTDLARFNLGGSGMASATAADLGLEDLPDALAIAGMNTHGHPELRSAIAKHYGVPIEQVLVAQGTSLANFLVLAAVLEPGDTVLCEEPCYEPLWSVARGLGAEVAWVPRARDGGFQPDVAAIRRGLARGARAVLLTDLHNPSAALLDRALRAEIMALCERRGGWLLLDEVYLSGVFDPAARERAQSAVGCSDRVIVTASLTKTYGLGGLRAGWAIAPPAVVERALAIVDHLGVDGVFLAEALAARALGQIDALSARAAARRAQTLPLVRAFAGEHGLGWAEPAGGFIAWLELPPGVQAWALAEHARAHHDTQIVPGDLFGDPRSIRLGFGAPADHVREGLARLGRALAEVRVVG